MKIALLVTWLFVAIPTFGQGENTTEKQYEQICIANPHPPSWCKPQQKIPTKPLTPEQKALLDAAAPGPEPVDPKVQSTNPALPPLEPAPNEVNTRLDNRVEPTPSPTSPEPVPQADYSQQRKQAFENSYALGSALGAALANAALKHRITKWCKQHPGHVNKIRLDSGQSVYCDEWNSYSGTSSLADLRPVERDLYDRMDVHRQGFASFQSIIDGAIAEGIQPTSFIVSARDDDLERWEEIRATLCPDHRGLPYIDLAGKQATCK
jgi:hypothetical protein